MSAIKTHVEVASNKSKRSGATKKKVALVHRDKRPSPKKVTKSARDSRNKKQITETEIHRIPVIDDAAETVSLLPITRGELQITLLSPFRFPLHQELLASQIARFAGILFVVVGALFTVFNIQHSEFFTLSSVGMGAQSITYNCTDPLSPNYNEAYCTSSNGTQTDTKPSATFILTGEQPFTGVIPINITVPLATEVTIYAINRETNAVIALGQAAKIDTSVWRFYWSTNQYDDGTYRIKAMIKNPYTTYKVEDDREYVVDNNPIITTTDNPTGTGAVSDTNTSSSGSTDTASSTTAISTTSTTTATSPQIRLEIEDDMPLEKTATIVTTVADAASVKLYARDVTTSEKKFLGYATYFGSHTWKFFWDTTTFRDGIYTMYALVSSASGENGTKIISNIEIKNVAESEELAPKVQNDTATSTSSIDDESMKVDDTDAVTVPAKIKIPYSNPLSGKVSVLFSSASAHFIEVYATAKGTLTSTFLGLAQQKTATEWVYLWNTNNIPNGEYEVYGQVRNAYGDAQSDRTAVSVKNASLVTYTNEQTSYIKSLESVRDEVKAIESSDPVKTETEKKTDESLMESDTHVTVTENDSEARSTDVAEDKVAESVTSFEEKLKIAIDAYARALRNNDDEGVAQAEKQIQTLRQETLSHINMLTADETTLQHIEEKVTTAVEMSEARVVRQETIIKERIGDAVHNDSDKDGISDYDEIRLFSTDPFAADTDRDGFTDEAEILSGFNPIDSTRESLVAYESPVETGITRDDVLSVTTITGLENEAGSTTQEQSLALISGVGLPNSFVTLYIFSTPIIVTVKTGADGSWNYIFDKELDDGEHEVYVGMTDNAGKIVAKSLPLAFVKTAQAFTPIDAAVEASVPESTFEPSFINQRALLVIASIAIVALGLVLIMLGLHVDTRTVRQIAIQ